jgi:hypothetical protein
MSYRVGCPDQEDYHWHSVRASDRILGEPEPRRTRGTEEDNIRDLTKVLKKRFDTGHRGALTLIPMPKPNRRACE